MLEPWRSRYLDAMGLASYVPRTPLPGAAPSLPIAWDSDAMVVSRFPEAVTVAPATAPVSLEPERAPERSRRLPEIVPASQPARPPAQPKGRSPGTATKQPVSIALFIVSLSSRVLLIDGLRDATSASRQLLANIARSIGGALTAEEVFRWPSVAHPHLQRSETAAREAVAGCLLRRLDGKPPQSLLVLGDAAQWLNADTCAGLGSAVGQLVSGPALTAALASAQAKRELWLALRSISFD